LTWSYLSTRFLNAFFVIFHPSWLLVLSYSGSRCVAEKDKRLGYYKQWDQNSEHIPSCVYKLHNSDKWTNRVIVTIFKFNHRLIAVSHDIFLTCVRPSVCK
jgi:hypothetical protein